MTEQKHIQIRDRAYALWLAHGCTEGKDWDFWLQAEREILGDAPPAEHPTPQAQAEAKPKVAAKPKTAAKPKAVATAKPKAVAKPRTPKPKTPSA